MIFRSHLYASTTCPPLLFTKIFFTGPRPRPSIPAKDGVDGYVVNLRLVNYAYDKPSGLITVTPHPHIITLNIMVHLDAQLKELSRVVLFTPLEPRRLYMGVEDVRLFRDSGGTVQFLGTGYHKNDTLGVVVGTYPLDLASPLELTQNFNPGTACEKNWVYVCPKGADTPLLVYRWHPLQVCQCVEDEIVVERVVPTPPLFATLRGSTHGFLYEDEMWFVTHFVEYATPRRYYHMVLVFDDAMTELRRVSPSFKFENQNIEYCLGLVVEHDRLLFSYSTWDETSKIAVSNRSSFPLVDWTSI